MTSGRTPSCTYEDVARVCEDLHARQALTLDNVRTELGRGSKSTLLVHYQAWKAQRTQRSAPPNADDMPPGVRAAWAESLAQARASATDELSLQLAETRRQLSFAQQSLQQSEGRAAAVESEGLTAVATVEAKIAASDNALAETRGKLVEAQMQVESLHQKLGAEHDAREKFRIGAAEATIRGDSAMSRLAALEAQNEAQRHDLDQARGDLAQARQDAAVAQAHLEHDNAVRATLSKGLEAAQQELAEMHTAHALLLQREHTARCRADVTEERCEHQSKELERLQRERQELVLALTMTNTNPAPAQPTKAAPTVPPTCEAADLS